MSKATKSIIMTGRGSIHVLGSPDVELAVRKPGQVAAQTPTGASVHRGARSGNANYDPGSGRFAPKAGKAPVEGAPVNPVAVTPSGLPQGVSFEEWARRQDSVRDASRSIPTLDEASVQKFLESRVNDLSKVDVQQFILDAQMQRLDDLTDVLAQQLQRGRDEVSLRVPRSYATRLLGEIEDNALVGVLNRLRARGFSDKDIVKKVIKGKINDEARRKKLLDALGQSDQGGEK